MHLGHTHLLIRISQLAVVGTALSCSGTTGKVSMTRGASASGNADLQNHQGNPNGPNSEDNPDNYNNPDQQAAVPNIPIAGTNLLADGACHFGNCGVVVKAKPGEQIISAASETGTSSSLILAGGSYSRVFFNGTSPGKVRVKLKLADGKTVEYLQDVAKIPNPDLVVATNEAVGDVAPFQRRYSLLQFSPVQGSLSKLDSVVLSANETNTDSTPSFVFDSSNSQAPIAYTLLGTSTKPYDPVTMTQGGIALVGSRWKSGEGFSPVASVGTSLKYRNFTAAPVGETSTARSIVLGGMKSAETNAPAGFKVWSFDAALSSTPTVLTSLSEANVWGASGIASLGGTGNYVLATTSPESCSFGLCESWYLYSNTGSHKLGTLHFELDQKAQGATHHGGLVARGGKVYAVGISAIASAPLFGSTLSVRSLDSAGTLGNVASKAVDFWPTSEPQILASWTNDGNSPRLFVSVYGITSNLQTTQLWIYTITNGQFDQGTLLDSFENQAHDPNGLAAGVNGLNQPVVLVVKDRAVVSSGSTSNELGLTAYTLDPTGHNPTKQDLATPAGISIRALTRIMTTVSGTVLSFAPQVADVQ